MSTVREGCTDFASYRRETESDVQESRNPNPTLQTYNAHDFVFSYFNKKLFRGELRPCLITLQRPRKAYGFFAGARFRSHDGTDIADEIALNPKYWGSGRTATETLSTLVHEMVHLWQHQYGKPSRGGYHNRGFARKMREVGLIASDTGKPDGKGVGQRMSHYIDAGGPFDVACAELLNSGFVIPYVEIVARNDHGRGDFGQVRGGSMQDQRDSLRSQAKAASKTPYVCPNCPDVRAWGRRGLRLRCLVCSGELEANFSGGDDDQWSPWRVAESHMPADQAGGVRS